MSLPAIAFGIACAMAPTAARSQGADPVTFNTYARVAVDAGGHPTSVEIPDADLPGPIRAFLARRVAELPFTPPGRDGTHGDAVTWVQVAACAAPMENGSYRLGMDVLGNGPRPAPRATVVPEYPRQALLAGDGGEFIMTVQVGVDGSARLVDLEQVQGSRQHFAKFRNSLRDYIAGMPFEPEHLAGTPVHSRVQMSIAFGTSTEAFDAHMRRLREKHLARALLSRECQEARGGPVSGIAIALDSPVKFAPGG